MKLKVKNIILYPKDHNLDPRFIKFEEDKVNVITGYSQRGKSAIISIIDYCLGSRHCNIPIGIIRNLVDKFAIYIALEDHNLFLARDSNDSTESSVMYMAPIKEKGEYSIFNSNSWINHKEEFQTNREEVIKYLEGIAGFENLSQKDDSFVTGFDSPSSFRDTSAFLFQTQNLVANPTTLFYKTDTFEHLKRLKVLFPLVLGYKSFDVITLEREINSLEKSLNEKKNRYEDLESRYENWQSDVYEYYSEAITLGFSNADINIDTSSVDQVLDELERIILDIKNNKLIVEGASLRYSQKLQDFEKRRSDILKELQTKKLKLTKIEQFDDIKKTYLSQAANTINERLKPIDWFLKQEGTNKCPFCGSVSEKAVEELLSLKEYQIQNRKIIEETKSLKFSFENEKLELKREIAEDERNLKLIEKNLDILIKENSEYYNKNRYQYEFAGKVEHVIENIRKLSPSSSILEEIDSLHNEIQILKRRLFKLNKKFDREDALRKVSSCIGEYLTMLPIEDHNQKIVHLDPEKGANIKIEDTKTNYNTFLSRIGSGANHMGYHLATMLGLHQYFLSLTESGKRNFVPSFLVIDQPSQVYFPEGFPDENENNNKNSKQIFKDLKDTRKIFETCSRFIKHVNFKTQVIILEHAPQKTWEGIDNIYLAKEWRGEKGIEDSNYDALIPSSWQEE